MIRFIFYIVIFYFVWRLLNSFFRPSRQTAPNQNSPSPKQKVTVQYDKDKAKSKVGSDVGEYVEFEEINEEK